MGIFKESKRKRYAKGFKWGRIEHKFEERTTTLLLFSVFVLLASMVFQYQLHIKESIYFFIFSFCLLVVCLLFRVIASFAHKREKHYMDALRFKRKK